LIVSLSAFAVVAGTLLGLYVARPIHDLADVARRIGAGELDVRARTGSEDEIGLLATTFNHMAQELIEKNRELERRVRDQHT
jgi:nitrate/nitrite-specific signal transduction histidine kinase